MPGESSLTRELTAVPTPGHTPGHMSILVTSRVERARVLGDAAHNPVQLENPDWVSRADMDPEVTRQTRRALMERLEREEIVVAAGPFPAPGVWKAIPPQGPRHWQGLLPAFHLLPFPLGGGWGGGPRVAPTNVPLEANLF